MRVLLTGATGRVGSFVHSGLLEMGFEVVTTTRSIDSTTSVASARYLDLSKPIQQAAVEDLDAVVHLAGISDRRSSATARDFKQNNSDATINLAVAAQQAGVKKFVFASTVLVHGDSATQPLTIETPYAPSDAYALSKATAEKALRSAEFSDMSVSILRLANVLDAQVAASSNDIAKRIVERTPIVPVPLPDNCRVAASPSAVLAAVSAALTNTLTSSCDIQFVCDSESGFARDVRRAAAESDRPRLVVPIPVAVWRLLDRIVGQFGGPSLAGAYANLQVTTRTDPE